MEKQIDEKFKEIDEQQFITPKDQLGYMEEYIIINHNNPNDNLMLNYSLSNSLEDIKIAIFRRTGLEIKLEKAKWQINSYLSVSVKNLMIKHQVLYSMTTFYEKKNRVIVINMHVGDNWYFTGYGVIKGRCHSWDYYETLEKFKRILRKLQNKFDLDDEEDD